MNDTAMNDAASFLLKVIVISVALSLLIKYGGPLLPVPEANHLNQWAIAIVLLPSCALGIGLVSILKKTP